MIYLKKKINLLLSCLGLFLLSSVNAQDLSVLPESGSLLYYTQLMHKFDSLVDIREDSFAIALQNSDNQINRRNQLREVYMELLGNIPDKTPLNPEVTDTIDRSDLGFKIEKLTFQSIPNHHVTANFYIPVPDTGGYPAVYVMPGHYGDGKAASILQSVCMLMAENGIAALIVDPMGQGERGQVINPATGNLAFPNNSGTTSQSYMDYGSLLAGRSASMWEIWDNHRGMDYLYSRTDVVDTSRIGITGSSGGGAQALFLMGLEYKRIKAAAVTSWVTNKTYIFAEDGSQAGSHHMPWQGNNTIDQPEQMLMMAPAPLIMLAGSQDFIDTAGTHDARDEVFKIYESLGASDRVAYFEAPDGHGYTRPKREAAVQWFRTWFYNDNSAIVDPEHSTLPVADLRCTSTGQVTTGFENEVTVPDLNASIADSYQSFRQSYWETEGKDSCLKMVKKLIRFNDNYSTPSAKTVGTISRENYTIDKMIISSAGEMDIPALLFKPKNLAGPAPVVIMLDESGKDNHAESGGYIERNFLDSGKIVLAADLRGIGETRDTRSDSKYGSDDHRLGIVSMYIGETMTGQRVEELFKIMDALDMDADADISDVSVIATGRLGSPALHYAAMDERVGELRIFGSYDSYMDIVNNAYLTNVMSYVVPRALEYYDLPDLVRSMGARKVNYHQSMESRLSNISISGGKLSPTFSDSVFNYDVINVTRQDIRVSGSLKDNAATLAGNGTYTLSGTDTTVALTVVAQDGVTTSVYFVTLPSWVGIANQSAGDQNRLEQNFPNPFSTATTIAFNMSEPGPVVLDIYDISGKQVISLNKLIPAPGRYQFDINGESFSSGVYFYQLQGSNFTETRKMICTER